MSSGIGDTIGCLISSFFISLGIICICIIVIFFSFCNSSSLYKKGYRQGQIDYQIGKIKYQLVETTTDKIIEVSDKK